MRHAANNQTELSWHVEPDWLVDALITHEATFCGRVWDPFCGGGMIPRGLLMAGVDAIGTDIAPRGYGLGEVDFFTAAASASSIVTSPPADRLEDAVRRALSLTTDRVAVLGPLAFLEGQERGRGLWREHPPARIWINMRGVYTPPGRDNVAAEGLVAFAWFVWQHGYTGKCELGWLLAP